MSITRRFRHPDTGAEGDYTDTLARRFGLVPADESAPSDVDEDLSFFDDSTEGDEPDDSEEEEAD